MNFKIKIHKNILKKNKKRKIFNFNFLKKKKKFPFLLALKKIKFFTNHLKLINLFVNKKSTKNLKKTKKDQFKKITEDTLINKNVNKELFYYKNIYNIKNKINTTIFLKKYLKNKNYFIFYNLFFRYITKKAIGARMGGGKNNSYNTFLQIVPGWPVLFFIYWGKNLLLYVLTILIQILPGRYKYII